MSSTLREASALSAPVPRSIGEWVRQIKSKQTINDMVESFHMSLIGDEVYVRLFDGVYNEQAVEGSLVADDLIAAQRIREAALKAKSALANEKLATIVKALRVVLKRYGMSRYQRRAQFSDRDDHAEANDDIGEIN